MLKLRRSKPLIDHLTDGRLSRSGAAADANDEGRLDLALCSLHILYLAILIL